MNAPRGLLVAAIAVLALASCKPGENGQRGGALERQLKTATMAADVDSVKRLLAAGADPNKMVPHEGHDQSSWKLALRQVRTGRRDQIEIIAAMIRAHANVEVAFGDEPSRNGGYTTQRTTPVLEAVSQNVPEVIRALMEGGLDPRFGQTALVLAVENGEAEIAHILVESGVDPNCHPGSTPLVAAIEARDVALMTYLEEHGAREKP